MARYIESISAALNGCAHCIANHREFWAKLNHGGSIPVASVRDESTGDLPWYSVIVTDYKGVEYDFTDLCEDSQEELFGIIVDELY